MERPGLMNKITEPSDVSHDTVREVVGVFPTAGALETAVEQLGMAGVDRSLISVLGVDVPRSDRIDELYRSAKQIEDDPTARRATFESRGTWTEGEFVAIALPLQIGGFAGAWAVAAAGGALIAGIGATVLGGAVAAGLGLLLYHAVARHHADSIESQIASGGLVLWVSTPDAAAEQRALAVLTRCGGMSVHTHATDRDWRVKAVLL